MDPKNVHLFACKSLLLGICSLTISAACARDLNVSIERAEIERSSTNTAAVKWHSVPGQAPIDVFLEFPGERERRLVSDDDRDGTFELSAQQADRRPIVLLVTESRQTFAIAERLLPLEGGRNFRDLGGYITEDGYRVKWGKVFRSGTMTNLTDRDYQLLSSLDIRVVCDFRADEEREREPTMWRTVGMKTDYYTRNYTTESKLREVLRSEALTADKVRHAMIDLYGEIAYDHAENYRTMFKSLAAGHAPLAFNCSAGKDRTGVAAALLLTMLGVPRETVVADYALSERVVNFEAQFASASAPKNSASKPGPWDFIGRLPPEVRAPLLRSEPEYIRSALARIEQREGSIDAYFRQVLGISAKEQEVIRQLLLEPDSSHL